MGSVLLCACLDGPLDVDVVAVAGGVVAGDGLAETISLVGSYQVIKKTTIILFLTNAFQLIFNLIFAMNFQLICNYGIYF